MTVCGIDHQHIDAGVEQRLASSRDIAVDPDGGADHEPTLGVKSRAVQRGAQGMFARHDAEQPSAVDQQGHLQVPVGELVEDLGRR